MASSMSLPEEDKDCTCAVCCDIFRDPVVLLCGHSFCSVCLQEWWRQSGVQTCPVCKETFPMPRPPRNLALRNLSDSLRQERSQRASSEQLCSLHSEELKFFCLDDQQPICVVCRDAKKHKKHNCVPISEAAEDHKTEFNIALMHLKTKLGAFKSEKVKCDKMASHIQLQAQQTEKRIKQEFQKMYQFLRAKEAVRIDALRKEATTKSQAMTIRSVNLTAEISSLTDKIEVIEEDMTAENISFMLNVKSTVERSRCDLPDPQTPSGALIDEAKHLGNLLHTVWEQMKEIIQYTPVVLDPNTAKTLLIISEDLTRVTKSERAQQLPNNPERLNSDFYMEVLGSESFSSGKHTWDVEVGNFWSVGVTVTSPIQVYQTNEWGIYMCTCTGVLREITPRDYTQIVLEDSFPKKIRIQLDYDQGTLSFFDLDRKAHVRTIRHRFTKPVSPYFKEITKIFTKKLQR